MNFRCVSWLALLGGMLGLGWCPVRAAEGPGTFRGATPLQWSVRMADAEMGRLGDKLVWQAGGGAKWDYAAGLFLLSLLHLNEVAPDQRYVKFTEAALGSQITADGSIRGYQETDYQLDAINPGKTVLALYQLTGEERYRQAAAQLRRQLDRQPRTSEGGFWHKERYTNQMWLDGIYMAEPFYAQYTQLFHGTSADIATIGRQFELVRAHLRDPVTGLYYHGWDSVKVQSWANPVTGASSNFWGRGQGWYALALVDTLDYLPAGQPLRAELIRQLQELAPALLKYQDAHSGLWWQVLDQGGQPGNYEEATASAMFVAALAKGINRGYLPRSDGPAILKGYGGIVTRLLQTDGPGGVSLTHCCKVAGLGFGRDGSYAYYLKEPVVENDLKGVGPFILAGLEVQRLSGAPGSAHP